MTKMSFHKWMDMQSEVYAYNGLLLRNKKEQSVDIWNGLKSIIELWVKKQIKWLHTRRVYDRITEMENRVAKS